MSEKKNYFTFYETFEEQLSGLSEEIQARFYLAIVKYGLHGKESEFTNPLEAALFKQFKFAIDNQKAKSKTNSDNRKNEKKENETKKKETEGKKTNENEKKGNETKKKETEGKKTNENEKKGNADEEEIEIEIEDEVEREKGEEIPAHESADMRINAPPSPSEIPKPPEKHESSKKFKPPTVEEVREYCRLRKNSISAEAFCSFYESKGWLIGKNKMRDWKRAVITWEERERGRGNAGTVWQKEHDAAADYMDLI